MFNSVGTAVQKNRCNIDFGKISEKERSVPNNIIEEWLKNVWPEVRPKLREGYKDDQIFNADETGLFFK